MILSHKHRFIFIKTIKTAGTSIETGLSKHCGPDDVITPISSEDEAQRRELGYLGPQHQFAGPQHYGLRDWVRRIRHGKRPLRFYHHMPASEVRDRVPATVWNDYFKFTVERNPWDRTLSLYYWYYRTEPRPTIDEYLEQGRHLALRDRGYDLYTIDDKVVVDRICKFETLAADLEEVRLQLGIPEPLELPRAKSNFRADKRHYREIMTPSARDRIAKDFAFEIERFGYEF